MSNQNPNAPMTQQASTLSTVAGFAGAIGAVLFASSPFTAYLTGGFGAMVMTKVLIGVLLIGFYLAVNGKAFVNRISGRTSGLLAISIATTVVALGLVGVANYLALENDREFDLTREGIHTLSDKTEKVLKRLNRDVRLLAFYASFEDEHILAQDILQRYGNASPRLSWEVVDPTVRTDLVEKYNITTYGNRVIVTSGEQEAPAKNLGEEELTNAIVRVTEQTTKTIYFLTGHGELDLEEKKEESGLEITARAVEAEGYAVRPLSFLQLDGVGESAVKIIAEGDDASIVDDGGDHPEKPAPPSVEVPNDAAVLIIAGPRVPLLAPELGAIERYLNRGGRVVALVDRGPETGLESVLRQWKVELNDDIVVDTNPMNRLMGLSSATPMIMPGREAHPVTEKMLTPAVFPMTRSLSVAAGGEAGVNAQVLVESGDTAWGETKPQGETAERGEDDNLGPVAVGIVATRPISEGMADRLTNEARLVVFGDADWVSNKYQEVQGNNDLFLNTLNWLAEQEEKIAIRPKTRASSQLFLSVQQLGSLQFFALDIIPALIIAIGLGITRLRRQR